jgi:hypothetical protein
MVAKQQVNDLDFAPKSCACLGEYCDFIQKGWINAKKIF